MNATTHTGIDTLLLAAHFLDQYGPTTPTASPDNHTSVGPHCAKNTGGPLQVVMPRKGSLKYTSTPLSELASQFAEVSMNECLPSESSSPTSSLPSSPCPSSADSDYAASLQSSKSASSRKSNPAIGRKVARSPQKTAHKVAKVAIVGGKAFSIPIAKRRDMQWRMSVERVSSAIETTPNSPVKETSRQLLEKVYDDITSHPPEFWTKIIAARILDRTPAQVNVWFSNRRQWFGPGDTFQCPFVDEAWAYTRRKTVKLRPAALEMSQEWSDSFFDDVLALYLDKGLEDTLRAECETKRKTIPRYKGKSKKRQIKHGE
ncbi:hypothetical protein EDD18DRAFT_1325545 [Armillaria luteobubalina]|uniref:Homeobox domain-containing protein n=1 Tax=Armillaria luteobubalina TaxID=153913 RepID=A0AA39QQI1_9AGAR|nr:hypothetical protein EDD18DRAFT_1325545 [Armillaria luteobubalina]